MLSLLRLRGPVGLGMLVSLSNLIWNEQALVDNFGLVSASCRVL